MSEQDWLAQLFEEHRRRLRAVAYRMLGSVSEADRVREQRLVLGIHAVGAIDDRVGQPRAQRLLPPNRA